MATEMQQRWTEAEAQMLADMDLENEDTWPTRVRERRDQLLNEAGEWPQDRNSAVELRQGLVEQAVKQQIAAHLAKFDSLFQALWSTTEAGTLTRALLAELDGYDYFLLTGIVAACLELVPALDKTFPQTVAQVFACQEA